MVLHPVARAAVLKLAVPLASVAVPRITLPSLKVMVSPSAGVPALELTVTANVTDTPCGDGFRLEESTVFVAILVTFCVRLPLLPAKRASPE